MPLAAGARLGPYEIATLLGAGGMGEVYRARDTTLGRDVAIKVLPELFAADPERLARFEREARVLASLNHPSIATLHGLERTGPATCLVMELVPGETLAQRISRGRLPIDEALSIAAQIASALEAAHEKAIVHRDLKPANIVVTPAGKVKVLDFGLAKASDTGGPSAASDAAAAVDVTASPTVAIGGTLAGVVLGTADYMSPEQARGKTVDRRADIWACGCVLYEMLTAKTPFGGETLTDIVAAVLKNEPDLDALPGETPPILRQLLRRCLQKDPGRRLQHAGDARIEIEEAIADPASRAFTMSTSPHSASRGLLPWALVLLLLSALALGQVTSWRRPSRAPAVVRLDLNMPAGVEVTTTNSPSFALSPDGDRIAFFGGTGGLRRLYVRRFDEADAIQVHGTQTGNLCLFSPDGKSVAIIGSDRILKKVSLGDGLVTTLATEADYAAAGAAWGADDRIVFVRAGALWEVSATGEGSARQLTTLDKSKGERAHAWPAVVAGGKVILFTTITLGSRTEMHIDALVRSTGERRVIVEAARYPMYTSSGHLVFFRDNALLAAPFDVDTLKLTGPAFAAVENIALDQTGAPMAALSTTGTLAYVTPGSVSRRLVWVSRQGVESAINDTPRPYQNPRLGPDGHRIVIEVAGGELWVQDVTRSTFTRLTSGDTVGNTFAAWTPDSRVVFRTVTGMSVVDPDVGGRPQPLPGTSVRDIPTSVSPDGR